MPVYKVVTPLSALVSLLILITGLAPAIIRPQTSHTLVVCFSIIFAFFLLVPFELSNLPAIQPDASLLSFLNPYLALRIIQAAILLPMALHVSVHFPRATETSAQMILGAYIFSALLLIAFFYSSIAWQRVATITLFFL